MTQATPDTLYELIRELRTGFNRLRDFSDRMNADTGITAAARAVLEHLVAQGPATVPRIARAKSVSRQHVQLLADALTQAGLATYQDNPGHKRSRLLVPTEAGRRLFQDIRTREARALSDLASGMSDAEAAGTLQTLRALNAALARIDPERY